MNERQLEITVISGDLNTPGSVIEIPWATGSLGCWPVYEVDPKTRKCKKTLQRFEVTRFGEHGFELKPIPRT